jgi:site-specific recombinase XerD
MQYSINLTPQRDSLDARLLPQLVDLWLAHIQRHTSKLTTDTYRWQIQRVLRWLESSGDAIGWALSRDSLTDLAHWLNDVGYGYHAQTDTLRRLRSCLHWAFADAGHTPIDCSSWVPGAVGDSPPMRKRAAIDDLHRLLQAAAAGHTGVRDHALIALLVGTGVRRAEATGIDVQDVHLDADGSGQIAIHRAKRVTGRLVQARMVAVDIWTGAQLRPWLDVRPARGPLWVRMSWDKTGYTDDRLGVDRISRIVRGAAEGAGLGDTITGPHDLRRAFATYFAKRHRNNALAAALLSKQLGHAKFAMTDHYILDDIDDLRDVIRSPLA